MILLDELKQQIPELEAMLAEASTQPDLKFNRLSDMIPLL